MDEKEEQWEFGLLFCSECGWAPVPDLVNVKKDHYCPQPNRLEPLEGLCGGRMKFKPISKSKN